MRKSPYYVKGRLVGGRSFSSSPREKSIRTTMAFSPEQAIKQVCAKIREVFGLLPNTFVLENPSATFISAQTPEKESRAWSPSQPSLPFIE